MDLDEKEEASRYIFLPEFPPPPVITSPKYTHAGVYAWGMSVRAKSHSTG